MEYNPVQILGVLASSLPRMLSLSGITTSFEAPMPFTFPRYRLGPGGELVAEQPLITSPEELRDPDRVRRVAPDIGAGAFQSLVPTGGEDEAGFEIAQRKAAWHRDVLHQNLENLHHTATGDPPGESRPPHPAVFVRDRRHDENTRVLLTLIDIGGADTLRHVQQMEPEDEASLLLDLLAHPTRDHVFTRSLVAAAELMRSI